MSLPVPANRDQWKSKARENNVPFTQIFSDCLALPSGSKFGMKHFLPLRTLFVDEKSLGVEVRTKFRAQHYPVAIRDRVLARMGKNEAMQQMRNFLTETVNIETRWDVDHYRDAGPFGNGLEKLYQIVSRTPPSKTTPEESDEDITDFKIFASSPMVESVANLNLGLAAKFQRLDINAANDGTPSTPPNRAHLSRGPDPDYRDTTEDDSLVDFGTPTTDLSSMPGTEKRVARKEFEKAALVLSDEQTVNMCLENLLIALSNAMGSYGRIVSDRKAFVVPKDATTHLYQACVDGLIMTADRQQIMAFVEVKRKLRSTNDSVLRQIGAQMAAFIFCYDNVVHKDR